ncbi:MAG: glycosyltransferase [Candidatus Acidiferrum sp.]
MIVNVDGGSQEQNADPALSPNGLPETEAPLGFRSLRTVHRVSAAFSAPPSQGLALRTILAAADLLRARACAVISPGTSNLTPEWIANLLRPVYRDNFDFVAPLYTRHKYHGLLARNLLYPMSRAVFGKRIRELYADEWAFSGRLASLCLNQDVWHEEAVRGRPEAWMAVCAITANLRCSQSFLGSKPQTATGSGADIVEVLRQTVGALFWCLEAKQSWWMERQGSEPVPTFGGDHELTSEVVDLNRRRIFQMFQSGVKELEPLLRSILTPETHDQIEKVASLNEDTFSFPDVLWVRTLYDFASSYHHAVINRDHLVQALVPLYRGKICSFLAEQGDLSPAAMEERNEELCLEFERQKTYLRERWKERVEVHV